MTSEYYPEEKFGHKLDRWLQKRVLWVGKHWLAVTNLFFLTYAGLPILAPILLTAGWTGPANLIYLLYRFTCHQFPSRAFFIFGEQIPMCERCLAIYGSLFLGGVIYSVARHWYRPFSARWYILFLIPIGVDGGTAMVSELIMGGVPIYALWAVGLAVLALAVIVLYKQDYLYWQNILFLAFGPLSLLYVQISGPRLSDVYFRTITGAIFGFGTVLMLYHLLEEAFTDIEQDMSYRLDQ